MKVEVSCMKQNSIKICKRCEKVPISCNKTVLLWTVVGDKRLVTNTKPPELQVEIIVIVEDLLRVVKIECTDITYICMFFMNVKIAVYLFNRVDEGKAS